MIVEMAIERRKTGNRKSEIQGALDPIALQEIIEILVAGRRRRDAVLIPRPARIGQAFGAGSSGKERMTLESLT